jgi:hypothetical protein
MRREDRLLLACTRQVFTPSHRQFVVGLCQEASIDWERVYTTAAQHGVAPLIYANLSSCPLAGCGLPATVQQRFEHSYYGNMILKAHVSRQIAESLAFLRKRDIDVMLVKGAALDLVVYDQPWYASHDVDLVLRVREAELTPALQQEITAFFKPFSGYEYDYFAHHDIVMNQVLPVDFRRIWSAAVRHEHRGQAVWVMCPEDLLLAACINSCRKRFFRLKSLLDISAIIERYPGLAWSTFLANARQYDCHHIAYSALLITEMTVGCQLPDGLLEQLPVGRLRAALIQRLIRQLSLDAFSMRHQGLELWQRKVAWPLLLSYLSFEPYQVWRRLHYVWHTRALDE